MITRIICLGNELVGDDGIGIRVGRVLLTLALPPGVVVELRPNLGFELLDVWQQTNRIILVDAMRTGRTPGSCSEFAPAEMAALTASAPCAHLVGIANVVDLAQHLPNSNAQPTVTVFGIEGERFDEYGTALSEAVRAALPIAVRSVLTLLGAGPDLQEQGRQACAYWMARDPSVHEICDTAPQPRLPSKP